MKSSVHDIQQNVEKMHRNIANAFVSIGLEIWCLYFFLQMALGHSSYAVALPCGTATLAVAARDSTQPKLRFFRARSPCARAGSAGGCKPGGTTVSIGVVCRGGASSACSTASERGRTLPKSDFQNHVFSEFLKYSLRT